MAKLAAYYLLLLYSTVFIKPVLPVIGDAVSHFLAEAEHRATVHAHNGDNHLHEELAETGAEHDSTSNKHILKAEDQVGVHEVPRPYSVCCGWLTFGTDYTSPAPIWLPIIYLSKQSPPPKFS